ncbi:UNVERIFIED_CONTAM: hypothetical protein Slati_2433400, partial [Sesamum latifolium]
NPVAANRVAQVVACEAPCLSARERPRDLLQARSTRSVVHQVAACKAPLSLSMQRPATSFQQRPAVVAILRSRELALNSKPAAAFDQRPREPALDGDQ